MSPPACPGDAALRAWLQEPPDAERSPALTAHINGCAACQHTLEQLSVVDERSSAATAGDDLLDDLRRRPPLDELEAEPHCARASRLAATAASSARGDSAQPDVAGAESLTQLGRYEVLSVLGQGGMGVVYKARNRKLDRLVAIKVLPPRKLGDAGAIARFAREMKAIARLAHPNIVAAHDADEADGKHFLVMEFIDGVDLRALVKDGGPLSVAQAVDYIMQAACGLQFAHEQGIIHRDVKPANFMLDRRGTVKVLDLGLARFVSTAETQAELTETGILLGTVDYLAPEQADNTGTADQRADVYSLGCALYYLLTGRTLYDGDSVIQKVLAHREKPIPALAAACPAAPAGLERVFAKMVAKRPEQRYQTMAEVIHDLQQPLAVRAGPTMASAPARSVRRRSFGGRRVLWGVAVVVLALSAGLVLWRHYPSSNEEQPPQEQAALEPLVQGTHAGQEWDGNVLRMTFCWCPPGRFLMGSPPNEAGRAEFESPPAAVVLSQGFWLGKCEVTQDEWQRLLGTRPSRFTGAATLPVENVAWDDCARFCATLTERQRQRGALPAGWEFRLPTEAQWEYGCRAGTTTAFHFGEQAAGIDDFAWHGHNAQIRAHEVGLKRANPWGLHDMHGNLWEWCHDWFHNVLPGGADPDVQEPGTGRVIRGGGWNAVPDLCRSGFRSGQKPAEPGHLLGFRVAAIQVR